MRNTIEAVVVERHLFGQAARAVGLDRFFGIVPYQPNAVAVAGLAAQLIR